jgi:UDP-glucose 4-epimerase
MKVLVAGGAGYIGSTVASACLDRGITPVVLDDLSTGREEFTRGRLFYRGDIADGALLDRVFDDHPDLAAAVHLAARIVVPESVADPLGYYENNVGRTLDLLGHLARRGCHRVVFSSSASIYRPGDDLTVDEDSALEPTSPYARTKAMAEQVLQDVAAATPVRAMSLRYFNPVGADPELRTGQQVANGSHVMGRLIEAHRAGTPFVLAGVDWPTRDGTGIRDYVHVWDLARAHVEALLRFDQVVTAAQPYQVVNLGTGRGTTVRELAEAFREVVDGRLEIVDGPRRPGDQVGSYTRSRRAEQLLGWSTELSVVDGARHSLEWDRLRPARLGRS